MAFNYFISYVSYYTLVALAGGIGLIFPSAVTKTFGLGGGLGFSLGLSPLMVLECPFKGLLFVSTSWSLISLGGSSISVGPEMGIKLKKKLKKKKWLDNWPFNKW